MSDGTYRGTHSSLKRAAALVICVCYHVVALAPCPHLTCAADWPQYMRDSEHTGDASDERLRLPLRLVAQVKLDDAVLTSPAVAGGRAYVIDQMGAAYCIDPDSSRVIWKSSPDGEGAMGSNTSSPCVTHRRVYYGTTAGSFHILDANIRDVNSGELLWKSMGFAPRTCSSAIPSNGRIFCNPQVNGMLYCFEPAAAISR